MNNQVPEYTLKEIVFGFGEMIIGTVAFVGVPSLLIASFYFPELRAPWW